MKKVASILKFAFLNDFLWRSDEWREKFRKRGTRRNRFLKLLQTQIPTSVYQNDTHTLLDMTVFLCYFILMNLMRYTLRKRGEVVILGHGPAGPPPTDCYLP
jgi:hypothetical protein